MCVYTHISCFHIFCLYWLLFQTSFCKNLWWNCCKRNVLTTPHLIDIWLTGFSWHFLHLLQSITFFYTFRRGFPGGQDGDGKESACNAGDPGLIPGLRRSPGEGNGNPLQYSCLENSKDRGARRATYSPWGHRESYTTERLTLSHLQCGLYRELLVFSYSHYLGYVFTKS